MRIPTRLLQALIVRGVVLWFLARVMAIAVLAFAEIRAEGALLSLWAVVLVPGLVQVDLHRRKELMLLRNLGVATAPAVVAGTVPALVLEAALMALRA